MQQGAHDQVAYYYRACIQVDGGQQTLLVQVEHLHVDVETCSTLSAGQTVADIWHQSGKPKNVHVCMVSWRAGWKGTVRMAHAVHAWLECAAQTARAHGGRYAAHCNYCAWP